MATTFFSKMLILLVVMLLASNKSSSGLTPNPKIKCIDKEKQALLKFKETLIDDAGSLSSWGSEANKEECCKWRGVTCNNLTGHITMLDLGNFWPVDYSSPPVGGISPSLFELQHLKYLDLSGNRFQGYYPSVPNHRLGNVSSLEYLSLRGTYTLKGGNPEWLSHFPWLRHLDLSSVDLNEATNWLESVSNNLPLLENLNLSHCFLRDQVPPTHPLNSSLSLTVVDLSYNSLSSWIPDAFEKMVSLVHLNLSYNYFEGGIPKSFANLSRLQLLDMQCNMLREPLPEILEKLSRSEKSLRVLNLESNVLNGSLPDFTRFTSLRKLYLGLNKLTGAFPESFRYMLPNLTVLELYGNRISGMLPDLSSFPSLMRLDLSNNSLNGTIESQFSDLSSLKYLDLSLNQLVFNISSSWIPPFLLHTIRLRSCKLGPDFPEWLRNQNNFSELDVSGAGISDVVPNWFWDNLPPNFVYFNLSYNQMKGLVPYFSLKSFGYPMVDLSSNCFTGKLPRLPPNVTSLNLSKNLFTGTISFLRANSSELRYLDLSNNQLSGRLPDCWGTFQNLRVLNLANNALSGKLPSSMGSLFRLGALLLRNNNFSGELPESLKSCWYLKILDLGGNRFTGNLQPWIGTNFSNLMILSVRFNNFYGGVPGFICQLNQIQVLDLSHNDFSGKLPRCFNGFWAFIWLTWDETIGVWYSTEGGGDTYLVDALVQWKRQEREYRKKLGLLKMIDFSCNKFSGEIPQEMGSLAELVSLNLSTNDFTGKILQNIDQMKNLESLDLSGNRLSGEIPGTLASLNFLSVLDLSNNNLSGKIPLSTQLQSFNASVYSGNPQLCGIPLPRKCPGEEEGGESPGNALGKKKGIQEEDEDTFITPGFYISMGVGFAFGFWAIFGTVLFSSLSRYALFKFFDKMADWLYVRTALNFARLQRRFRG